MKFLHTADIHLDSPLRGLERYEGAPVQEMRLASRRALENTVSLALEEAVDFVLIAGDIYDGADRAPRAQLRFLSGLKRLSERGVKTFIVHGNHDPLDSRSALRGDWPKGVTMFGSDAVETVEVTVNGAGAAGGSATVFVHGISYATRDTTANLARGFKRTGGTALNIGLLHTNVGGVTGHASYAPCSLGDLLAADMDYWALGHIHQKMFLKEGGPWIAYSGDTQGRSPKPSETGEKGVLLAEVSGATIGPVTFHPIDAVRFVPCAIDIAEAVDIAALQDLVEARVNDLRSEHDDRSLIVRITFEGRGAAASDLHGDATLAALRDELRSVYESVQPFVWIESLRDHSRGLLDREALRQSDSLSADLLRLADGLDADPEAAAAFAGTAAEALDRPGMVLKALRDLEADAPDAIIAEALELALDGLERETDA